MDQEKVFCEGSEGKETFLDHKNIGLKSHQNLYFFKVVSPWFLSKKDILLILCFYAKWIKKNRFCEVIERKKSSLDYKNIVSKNPSFAFFLMS